MAEREGSPCRACHQGVHSWPRVVVGPLTPLHDSRCGTPHRFIPSGKITSAYDEPYYPPPTGEPGDELFLLSAWGICETFVGQPDVIKRMLRGIVLSHQGGVRPVLHRLGTYDEAGALVAHWRVEGSD